MFKRTVQKRGMAHRGIALMLSLIMAMTSTFALTACGDTGSNSNGSESSESTLPAANITLQIFAANSLEKALPEVQALYTKENPNVTFDDTQFKSSGDLVAELQGGAPADILITASKATMDTAEENASVDAATRSDMFKNDLIVVRQAGSNVAIESLEDVNSEAVTKVAIGDADAVPAGSYTNQSLFTIGLYTDESGKGGAYEESFGTKVILQSSVGNIAKTVSTGDAQIGFAYTSDLYRYDGIEEAFVVPTDAHKAIIYPGAVVTDSANAKEAARFLEFCMNDAEALKVWAEYGFELV